MAVLTRYDQDEEGHVTIIDDATVVVRSWWTDNDPGCDFCISFAPDHESESIASVNLSYADVKKLISVIQEKVNVPVLF